MDESIIKSNNYGIKGDGKKPPRLMPGVSFLYGHIEHDGRKSMQKKKGGK